MKKQIRIRRGDIIMCDLPERTGSSVQGNKRPAVVLSNDTSNTYSPVLSIVPLTSSKKKKLPVHSVVNSTPLCSTSLAEQLTTIDKRSVLEVIGRVTTDELRGIVRTVRIQLAI